MKIINRGALFTFLMVGMFFSMSANSFALAREITLRLHHFMSEKSNLHRLMLVPLAERLAQESNGRLRLEIYPAMMLGGRATDLYDQAADGAVDIVLTLPGYTAGRFLPSEVFELPFIMEDRVATSKAYWDFIESDFQNNEYEETKILTGWVHGPGFLHTKTPVRRLEDVRGMELRGASRLITDLIGELGGIPVGMALPLIPESLSKGVISGAAVPWEITTAIRLSELVSYHTEFTGPRALYTARLILAMNWDAYDSLPADLRAILDRATGKYLAEFTANMLERADNAAREGAIKRGNTVIRLDAREVDRWISAAQPVYKRWISGASRRGFDGQKTLQKARQLIERNKSENR